MSKSVLAVLALCLSFHAQISRAEPTPTVIDSPAAIEAALAGSIRHELVRDFALCQLRAAWWGGYDVAVHVGGSAAADGQPLVFKVHGDRLSREPEPESKTELADVQGAGDVVFVTAREAFDKGVPFFISDAALVSPTELRYTVHSNPAAPVSGAVLMMEFRSDLVSGTALEVKKPISSAAEPQTRTFDLSSPLDPEDQNRFEMATVLANQQGCLASNTVELNPLLRPADE